MTAILMRSALVFHGHQPPPELHSILDDGFTRRVVTWAEHLDERRQRQRERLEVLRRGPQRRAYKLWVAYFEQLIFGGWHAFLENREGCHWISRRGEMPAQIMRLFPLVLPFGDEGERLREMLWMEAFAKAYKRRMHHGRPLGVAVVWSEDVFRGPFSLPAQSREVRQ